MSGFKTPPNTKYVGRPGKWGNPYRVEDHGPEKAVELYRDHVRGREVEIMAELGGRNLSCFCKLSNPCHADVLLEIANRPPYRMLTTRIKNQNNLK